MLKSRAERTATRKTETSWTFKGAADLLDIVFGYRYFHIGGDEHNAEPPAIPFVWQKPDHDSNLVVIVGENASGKSFIRRLVTGICHQAKVECIRISMEGRSDTFGGMRSFVYGDEGYRSTGENSASTVLVGIRTCRDRTTPHVMFWDEPDFGLSESWAAGMGQTIAEFGDNPGAHTKATFVVTHSKPLVRQFAGMQKRPHFIAVGDGDLPKSLDEWMCREVKPRDLSKLSSESHRRFLKIQALLDTIEK